jgi:hypothetical protein
VILGSSPQKRPVSVDVATSDSTSAASTIDRRALLADALEKLSQAGFVQNADPVEGVVSMQRVWQGLEEDSVMVDSVTIHMRDQALAVREGDGDGAPIWGPMRGPWSDLVAVVLALSPPEEFVVVLAGGRWRQGWRYLGVCHDGGCWKADGDLSNSIEW